MLGERFHYLTLRELPTAPEVVEDADTFAGNATKKATELARWLGTETAERWVLADDSGLEVDALGGQPGVQSARFAALDSGQSGNSPDAANNAKLLHRLRDVPLEKRTARFRCVLALTPVRGPQVESASPVCYADEFSVPTYLFEGACEGRIQFAARGSGGFGYDPFFVPVGFELSFAELGEAVKNQISHRARALAQLKAHLAATA
jgi:XTP/dITP diphosphohydrolase